MRDAILEECPVGETGQLVVERLVPQLLLEALALADISDVEHHAAHVGILLEVRAYGLDADIATICTAEPKLEGSDAVAITGADDECRRLVFVVGVGERDELATFELRR